MTTSAGIQRDAALKIARWLISKDRSADALALLCVGAVSGPNDAAGQELLAEALRLVPNSPIAKAAFERMEGKGTAGDHAALDEAIQRFGPAEIEKLEKERSRPQFMRAQVGFNNNVKYKDRVYHVQTEDSGLKMPHIITHCFADGGRVIKSHKRSYAEHAERADAPQFVRSLMKAQHMEMVLALREGKFDEVIAGRAMGGMTVFTEPPQVDLQQLATRKAKGKDGAHAESAAPPPAPAPIQPTKSAPVRFTLRVIRSLVQGPEKYEPPGDDVVIGASGNVPLTGERFCHPSEGIFYFKHGELFLEDLEGGNGLFIRIRRPVELEPGDEFIVGDQLLRVERNPPRDDGPGPGPTYMWFSPHPPSAFRVVQILEGGALGAVRLAGGTTLQIGRNEGDLTFPKDPFVADRHCFAEEQAGVIVLTDLGSKWGVFVRIRGEQKILHGDELLVGRTRLRVELPEFAGDPQL
jgi:pSer/pThr/pTyr-binding forkhead associated (FHA) protein